MSRCFPYPPPGYEKSIALVESIKLQKEREKVKQDRKKEKKREKKQKEKSRGEREKPEDKRRSHRKRHYGELSQWTYKSGGHYVKTREGESEQLEKSSLTEEQGCPAAIVNFCDSSDSTQNSSKRIKHESSIQNFCDSFDSTQNSSKRLKKHESAEVCPTPHGIGFRIRLPLSRHKDLEPPSSSEQPCLSERTQAAPAQPETTVFMLHQPPSAEEQPCFSGRTDATPPTDSHKITDHKSASSEARRTHRSNHRSHDCGDTRRMYKKLLVDWNPPPPQMENPGVDDQDWLFGKTSGRQRLQGETREQDANEDSGLGVALCSWPPRACFWPEVGVHALPYAVPF